MYHNNNNNSRISIPPSVVTSEAARFFDATQDLFLHQHVQDYTRFRMGQNPSLLDYIFTALYCIVLTAFTTDISLQITSSNTV